jgi:uracil-DNA glycosylase
MRAPEERGRSLALTQEVRACTVCGDLPLGPRPIVQFSDAARILVIGQAPGRKAHQSGVPFEDASGERLCDWMGIDLATLHDPARIAIVSMALCYPGKASGGDRPPPPGCAAQWHERIFKTLPRDRFTLLVGTYAQTAYLPHTKGWRLAERVRRAARFAPYFPLPHPSWRATLFMREHPWFADEILPSLRREIAARLWGETCKAARTGTRHETASHQRPGSR